MKIFPLRKTANWMTNYAIKLLTTSSCFLFKIYMHISIIRWTPILLIFEVWNKKFHFKWNQHDKLFFLQMSYLINPDGYETRHYCWMSIEKGMVISFIVPVFLLIAVSNLFSYHISRSTQSTNYSSSSMSIIWSNKKLHL